MKPQAYERPKAGLKISVRVLCDCAPVTGADSKRPTAWFRREPNDGFTEPEGGISAGAEVIAKQVFREAEGDALQCITGGK